MRRHSSSHSKFLTLGWHAERTGWYPAGRGDWVEDDETVGLFAVGGGLLPPSSYV